MAANVNTAGANELLELWREASDPAVRDRLVLDHLPLV